MSKHDKPKEPGKPEDDGQGGGRPVPPPPPPGKHEKK